MASSSQRQEMKVSKFRDICHLYFRLVGPYLDATQEASPYQTRRRDTKWVLMLQNFLFNRSTAKCTIYIHTANERRLGEIIGTNVAGKLHTGRSRNDQIATDMRMWLRDELNLIEEHLIDLLKVIAQRAEQDIDYIMPSYTHLQRAQPIRWSHWLLSYATAFQSDLERMRFTKRNVNKLPLGSGAVAGNAFGIDRMQLAKELGFEGLIMNSMSAVGDRDFVVEVLQCASTIGSHLSRWSEDLIIYSSLEFGYVRLADAYTTGSSLMPQKKNSDSLELLRGKSGRIFGAMAGLMMSIKGIPSTYNKDLQESLQPMLDTVKTLKDGLQIAGRALATATVYPDKMRAALSPDMLATDLAEYLVRKGKLCDTLDLLKPLLLISAQVYHSVRRTTWRARWSHLPKMRTKG
jgi:argininosuccinate lyase